MRFYVVVLGLFVLAAVTLLRLFGTEGRTWLEILLVVGGLIPSIVRHTPRLNLAWVKLKFYVANTSTTWELSVSFRQMTTAVDVSAISQELIRWAEVGAPITATERRAVVRLLRRFVVEIHHDPGVAVGLPEDLTDESLAISIAPVTVGYRDSRRFLEHDLLPLLEHVRSIANATWASYALRVDLPERNPFYGIYLQHLDLTAIQDFRIEFQVPSRSRRTNVTVGKERLTIVADTVEAFRAGITAALAFRVPAA